MKTGILFTLLISLALTSCKKSDSSNGITIAKESYTLPGDTLFPEGIAYNNKTGTFYTGSSSNGDIIRVNVETGETGLLASGVAQGRKVATGMKIDALNRLWVCGGADNKIQVLNLDGTLIKSWDTKVLFSSGFINDCIIDNAYIYFTDSQIKKIYRTSVTETTPSNLEEWLTFTDAQILYTTGTNANGIVSTADNKYLIIVVSTSGKLFRIDKTTKAISEITLNTPVPSGDGLHLEGNTLYVSRNATNLIFPVVLNTDFTQGTVGSGFGTNLQGNTTIAKAGPYFLVVNGQLSKRGTGTQTLPFNVSRITIP